MSTQIHENRILTTAEAAQYVGVSRGTVYRWIKMGLLPYEEYIGAGPTGRRILRIRRVDLDLFIRDHYRSTAAKGWAPRPEPPPPDCHPAVTMDADTTKSLPFIEDDYTDEAQNGPEGVG